MKKLTKKQRAELFQFFYDCHYKVWDEIVKSLRQDGLFDSKSDFLRFKRDIIERIFNTHMWGHCFGCELSIRCLSKDCDNCFLNLECTGYRSWYSKCYYDKESIYYAEKIRNCGWEDNPNISDQKLINLLIKMLEGAIDE